MESLVVVRETRERTALTCELALAVWLPTLCCAAASRTTKPNSAPAWSFGGSLVQFGRLVALTSQSSAGAEAEDGIESVVSTLEPFLIKFALTPGSACLIFTSNTLVKASTPPLLLFLPIVLEGMRQRIPPVH